MSMERLHPLSAVIRVLSYGVNGFLIPTFLAFVGGNVLGDLVGIELPATDLLVVLAPLGLAVGATYGYLTYRRFSYELTPDTFDIARGVLGRTEREIPIRRIQNVDVQQNVFHQLFDVAVVRIETAGGGATEATLSVVDIDEARAIQRGIRERRARLRESNGADATAAEPTDADATTAGPTDADATTAGPTDAETTAADSVADEPAATADETSRARREDALGEDGAHDDALAHGAEDWNDPAGVWDDEEDYDQLLALRFADLLVLAATNFQLGSLLFILVGFPLAGDVATNVLLAAAEPFGGPASLDPNVVTPDQYFVLGGVAGPLVLVGGYVLSAALAVLEYYEFELGRRGNDLVYERGLLQRYSGSIPTDKIQTLTVRETAPMRWLGYAALDVETAGYAGGGGNAGTQAAVPVATRDRVLDLADDLFAYDDPGLERPPKRARERYAVRYSLVVLAAVAVAYAGAQLYPSFTLWYVPAIALLAVPPAAHLKWAHRGYAVRDDHVVVRTGFWRRRTYVVPYYRLQTVVGSATVFQRRRHLASLVADTASSATLSRSSPTAHDLDADDVDRLQHELRDRLQAHLGGDHADEPPGDHVDGGDGPDDHGGATPTSD
ncbi:PH domain-containing protein [Halorubellus salinus]|uniref:PH domain-containing protein n=1 Tax=Halorubellus salinus TaxID=755309 RepID=UPI001D095FC1|nr:PH domain-containing protein [Halorubellus salinus]